MFLDYYLTVPPKDFAPLLPFTFTDTDLRPAEAIDDLIPDKFYSKMELLGYIKASREKCKELIGSLTDAVDKERFTEVNQTGAMDYPILEIILYKYAAYSTPYCSVKPDDKTSTYINIWNGCFKLAKIFNQRRNDGILLPNFYSLIFGSIIFITRLHVKCFIKRLKIHQRAIHTPHRRRMRVGIYVQAQKRISCLYPPYPGN